MEYAKILLTEEQKLELTKISDNIKRFFFQICEKQRFQESNNLHSAKQHCLRNTFDFLRTYGINITFVFRMCHGI